MVKNKKTRLILLISAAVILTLCALWYIFRDTDSERSRICKMLAERGYTVYEDDLFFAYDEKGTSVAAALNMEEAELSDAVEASKRGGFPSDIEKKGSVTLILAKTDDATICMYMLDGEFELVFLQYDDGGIGAVSNRH